MCDCSLASEEGEKSIGTGERDELVDGSRLACLLKVCL